jgi:hypothetical protein
MVGRTHCDRDTGKKLWQYIQVEIHKTPPLARHVT